MTYSGSQNLQEMETVVKSGSSCSKLHEVSIPAVTSLRPVQGILDSRSSRTIANSNAGLQRRVTRALSWTTNLQIRLWFPLGPFPCFFQAHFHFLMSAFFLLFPDSCCPWCLNAQVAVSTWSAFLPLKCSDAKTLYFLWNCLAENLSATWLNGFWDKKFTGWHEWFALNPTRVKPVTPWSAVYFAGVPFVISPRLRSEELRGRRQKPGKRINSWWSPRWGRSRGVGSTRLR